RMLGQWATELNHVTGIVGGFDSQQKHAGQDGVRFTMVPRARQAAAVRFLNDNAFATPTWAIKPDLLRRIEPTGMLDRVKAAQLKRIDRNGLGASNRQSNARAPGGREGSDRQSA